MEMKGDPTKGLFNGNPYVLSNGTASSGIFTSPPKTEWTLRTPAIGDAEVFGKAAKVYLTGTTSAVPSGSTYAVSPADLDDVDTTPIVEALVRDLIHRKYPRAKLK